MKARGVIFDLDGTLVDNMELHAWAFAEFMARHGLRPLDDAQRARLDGKRNTDIFPDLLGRNLPREELLAECLAFEDSRSGMAAARAAGMVCVAISTSFSVEAFRAAGAAPDHVLPDFDAFLSGPFLELLEVNAAAEPAR